ncbi:MAG TPA: sulfurtransferase TusA family protein [Caulobacteraceae bacterium]
MNAPPEILIDARGHRCPVPTLKLARAMAKSPAGSRVRLLADDPLAGIDVPHFCAQGGFNVVTIEEGAASVAFLIEKPARQRGAARRLGNDAPPG